MDNDGSASRALPSLVIAGSLFLAAGAIGQAHAQDDTIDADKARRLAERFERDAKVLTIFDRAGEVVTTVGEPQLYGVGVMSPDGTRIAVPILDLAAETFDVWIVDVDSGESRKLRSNAKNSEEWMSQPVWSPDGKDIAYVALRAGYEGIYRIPANGDSAEELLYRDDRADLILGDWSMDGRFVSFSVSDGYFEGSLYVLPMEGRGERSPVTVLHGEAQLKAGSFSPDSRRLSFVSDASGRQEFYVLELDPIPDRPVQSAEPTIYQITRRGSDNPLRSAWREDGVEFYYFAADRGIMASSFDELRGSRVGATSLLFRPSQVIGTAPLRGSVSRDGERVLIAVPHKPTLEQVTVFDRSGTVLNELGEPGIYRNPTISPDGKAVAAMRVDPDTNATDIWTFDLESGAGSAITSDDWDDNWPVWSPSGLDLAYRTERGLYTEIHIKPASGIGESRRVYRYTPGAYLQLTDWSADGRFLTFQDGCWGVLYLVPLSTPQPDDTQAIEWLRDEFQVAEARFSPDERFIAYLTDERKPDVFDIYIAPFDRNEPYRPDGPAVPTQLRGNAALGMITWRGDGRELYFLSEDWEVMAVAVETSPTVQFGVPEVLFSLPGPLPGNPKQWKSVSPDGERFVFVMKVPADL